MLKKQNVQKKSRLKKQYNHSAVVSNDCNHTDDHRYDDGCYNFDLSRGKFSWTGTAWNMRLQDL